MKYFFRTVLALIGLFIAISCQQPPYVILTGPGALSFTCDGGSQSFSFSANRKWTVTSSESWCKVTPSSGAAGEEGISIGVTVDKNPTYETRECTLAIRVEELTETVTVRQDMGLGLVVSPNIYEVSCAAQTIEVEVLANVDYTVEIERPEDDWLSYGGTKGLPKGTIVLAVSENETYEAREGRIALKQTDGNLVERITVRQAQNDGLFLSVPEYNLSNTSHTLTLEVQANVEYEVTPGVNWIHYVSSSSTKALTTSQITLQIDANDTYDVRSGQVIVRQRGGNLSGVVTVNQEENYGIFLSKEVIEISKEAQTVEVEVRYNVDLDIIVPENVMGVMVGDVGYSDQNTQTKALNTRKYRLQIKENTAPDSREASITFKQKNGALSGTVKIIQAQNDMIDVSTSEIIIPYEGGTAPVTIESNIDVKVDVQSGANWLSVSKNARTKGLVQSSYTISAAGNEGNQRDAVVVFSGKGIAKKVRIIQKSFPLILSESSVVADCLDGATVSISVDAAGEWSVREKGSSILTLSKDGGEAGSWLVTISVNGANCTNTDRYATVEFICDGIARTVQIKQVPAFRFDSLDHIIPASGGSHQFSFHFPRPFDSGTVKTHDYDNGFYELIHYTGEDNAPQTLMSRFEVSQANPVDTYMYVSYNFQANYGKSARTGRFRLCFYEDGQTLVSEWINVTQLGDAAASDEADGITTILQQHSKGSGVPVVILGDGFTKNDISNGLFASAARKAYGYFFSVEPVSSLKDYFDVWAITAVSSSAKFDGTTRFASSFTGGTRIKGADDLAVRYACKAVPPDKTDDMLIIIILNTDRYAGTCYLYYLEYPDHMKMTYSVAYIPMTDERDITFEEVLHHEACGHGLGKLADEYSRNGTIPSANADRLILYHNAGAYVNVDLHSDVSSTLWADFASDPRFGYEKIGAYQGGYTYSFGVYRPTQTSIMDSNKGVFNAPSRAQIYKRVMGIANNRDWSFDYEDFVRFDADFRSGHYNNSNQTKALKHALPDGFTPLAPPVLVKDKRPRK